MEYPEVTLSGAVSSIAINDKAIVKALSNIYHKRFNVKREIEPELFKETVRLFNEAAAIGISDGIDGGDDMPSDDFLQAIKTNNEVFSAFRVHRMQNDIAARMTNDDGQLKSFSQFARDVRPYTDHQNRQWLQTEFNTAVIRAHQAADWQQFEREKDVLPNLEWIPSTSLTPGLDHQVFWGTIRPVDDPFWNEHRPGDRWNCKCRLVSTDKAITPVQEGGDMDRPNRGLENNPGKDGQLISDKHPYFPENCSVCPFGHGKLWALAAGKKKDCAACGGMEKATGKAEEKSEASIERHKRLEEMKPLLKIKHEKQTDDKTLKVGFTKRGNEHLYSDTFGRSSVLQKEDLKSLDKVLDKATFIEDSELTHPRKDGIDRFYYFEGTIRGKKVRLNVARKIEKSNNGFTKVIHFLYSINDIK
ncbi:MAG TPA: phage minor head protein [Paludibacteraceae bacterium]|nr:phage minor head protein [Paludibacteraceae bacterium]HQK35610.1 phage minor head protein [Spirochaetales bacterium]